MSMSGAPVGTAFVDILPKTDSFASSLSGQLKSAISSAAGSADMSPLTKSLNTGLLALGGAAIAGIYRGIKATQDWATEIKGLQRVTGQSAEDASKLAAASDVLGVSTTQLTTGFTILSSKVSTGSSALEKYGIVTQDAEGKQLPLADILTEIQTKFQELPPGMQQTAMATQLFGRSGRNLIPILGATSGQMDELYQHAQDLGLVMSQDDLDAAKELGTAQRELGESFKGLSIQLGKVFIPVLTEITKGMTAVVEVFGKIPVPIKVATVLFLGLNTAIFAVRVGLKLAGEWFEKATATVETNTTATALNTDAVTSNADVIGDTAALENATSSIDTATTATEVNTQATLENTGASELNATTSEISAAANDTAAISELDLAGATSAAQAAHELKVTAIETDTAATITNTSANDLNAVSITLTGDALAGSVAAKELDTTATSMNAASITMNGASLGVATAVREVHTAAVEVDTAMNELNTVGIELNTAADLENAAASGILAGALAVLAGAVTTVGEAFMEVLGSINFVALAIRIAILAIGFIVIKNWGTIKDFAISVWNTIKGAVTGAWDAIKAAVSSAASVIGPAIAGVASALQGVWNALVGAFSSIVASIATVIGTLINVFVGLWKAVGPIAMLIAKAWGALFVGQLLVTITILEYALKGLAVVITVLGKIIAAVLQVAAKIIVVAANIIITAINFVIGVVNQLIGVWRMVWSVIGPIVTQIGQAIASVFGSIVSVIGSFVSAVASVFGALGSIIGAVISAFGSLWKVIGPAVITIGKIIAVVIGGIIIGTFLVFMNILKVVGGVIAGWAKFVAGAIKVVAGVFQALASVVGPILSGIVSLLASGVAAQIKVTFAVIGAVVGVVIHIFQMLWDVAKAVFGPPLIALFNILADVWHTLQDAASGLGDILSAVWTGIQNGFNDVVNVFIDGINIIIQAWNDLPFHDDVGKIPTLDTINEGTVALAGNTDTATAATNNYVSAADKAAKMDERRAAFQTALNTALVTTASDGSTQTSAALDVISKHVDSLGSAFDKFGAVSGIDMSTYKDNLTALIEDPTNHTAAEVKTQMQAMGGVYQQWHDQIVANLGGAGDALSGFADKSNVDLGKATGSLNDYAGKLKRFGNDIETIQKRYGNRAAAFIQFASENGLSYLGLADSIAKGNVKAGNSFFSAYKGVDTAAQTTADTIAHALGTTFDHILNQFKIMWNQVLEALGKPHAFQINNGPAKKSIDDVRHDLASYHEDAAKKPKMPAPNNGPSKKAINDTRRDLASYHGDVAKSPKLAPPDTKDAKGSIADVNRDVVNLHGLYGKKVTLNTDTSQAESQLRTLDSNISQLVNSKHLITLTGQYKPPPNVPGGGNAAGGIIRGASGFVTRGPTFLVGEGHAPTPAGPGAEAVIPLNKRGQKIMRDTFAMPEEHQAQQGVAAFAPSTVAGKLRVTDWRSGLATLAAEMTWEDAVRSR